MKGSKLIIEELSSILFQSAKIKGKNSEQLLADFFCSEMFGSHPWTALNFSLPWTPLTQLKKKKSTSSNYRKTMFAWRWETWMSSSRQYNYCL